MDPLAEQLRRELKALGPNHPNVAKSLGMLEPKAPPEQPPVFHQEVLHVLEVGFGVVVTEQGQALALPFQLLAQARPGAAGRSFAAIGNIAARFLVDVAADVDDAIDQLVALRGA